MIYKVISFRFKRQCTVSEKCTATFGVLFAVWNVQLWFTSFFVSLNFGWVKHALLDEKFVSVHSCFWSLLFFEQTNLDRATHTLTIDLDECPRIVDDVKIIFFSSSNVSIASSLVIRFRSVT